MPEPSRSFPQRPIRPIRPEGRPATPMTGEEPRRWRITPQLAIGLFILALGVVLMLDRVGVLEASRVLRYWPVGLLVIGVVTWARDRRGRGRFWGVVWIVIGSWLLLNVLEIVRVGFWELFWPIVLVLVGLKLVLHASRTTRADGEPTGTASLFAMMGGSRRNVEEAPFQGAQITAIMGGCILDLRRATVEPGEVPSIELFALMGGIELWVPGDWRVDADDVVPIMGGVEDKRLPPVSVPEGPGPVAPPVRLRLRGQVIMGGLVIKTS